MKIPTSFINRSRTVCLTLFAGAFVLPLSLLFAQGTQPGTAGDYTSVDISNTVTTGPVINVKQITATNSFSSSPWDSLADTPKIGVGRTSLMCPKIN